MSSTRPCSRSTRSSSSPGPIPSSMRWATTPGHPTSSNSGSASSDRRRTLLLRRLADAFDAYPDGFELDLQEMAGALGLERHPGRNSSFARTLQRGVQFGLAQPHSHGMRVRRRLPPLSHRQLGRLPAGAAGRSTSGGSTTRRGRGRSQQAGLERSVDQQPTRRRWRPWSASRRRGRPHRAGDVEVGPRHVADELLQEQPGGDGAAARAADVLEVGHVAVELLAVARSAAAAARPARRPGRRPPRTWSIQRVVVAHDAGDLQAEGHHAARR